MSAAAVVGAEDVEDEDELVMTLSSAPEFAEEGVVGEAAGRESDRACGGEGEVVVV